MHILDFPPELIHTMLYHMSLSRGVTRALRLRLVCKLFRDSIQPALFETRLLDMFMHKSVHYSDVRNEEHMRAWYVRERHGAERFWHSYIAYRVRNETDPQIGRLLEIRQIGEAYCSRTGLDDLNSTIDSLCWMALERAAGWPTFRRAYALDPERRAEEPDLGLNLLSAAAYLGNLPLAKQLLVEGHCPASNNELFDTPLRLAAWAGHADILKLFQEHLPDYERTGPKRYQWRAKSGPGPITGAAIRGDVGMLQLAIYPPSRAAPNSSDFAGFPYGHVVLKPPYEDERIPELYHAVRMTRSVEAFKYICSFFSQGEDRSRVVSNLIRHHCESGNTEIVRYLVDTYGFLEMNVYGRNMSGDNCLVGAARGWQEDVVDFLLERGMDPELHPCDVTAMDAATSAGSMSIVRKLVSHGAKTDAWGLHYLTNAVRLEHTALVEYLLERDIGRDYSSDHKCVLKDATKWGLESMVELIQRWDEEHQT